jgi:hypothetical protein
VSAVYRFRFFFDPGSGTCLWSANDAAQERFDYPVDHHELPLSPETLARLEALVDRFDGCLDWDDPGGPGGWSVDDARRFEADADVELERLRAELGEAFEIVAEHRRMSGG